MSTFRNIETKLTALTIVVFGVVLSIFCCSVYFVFSNQLASDTRADLRRLADAVIASIDFDDDEQKNPKSAKPDLILSEMPDTSDVLKVMRLEWYDLNGKFIASRGTLPLATPLVKREEFEQIQNPHAISLTKSVIVQGNLLGYVRVAEPLDKQDRAIANLSMGLFVGVILSLIASGLGTALLVRNSMAPINENMMKLRQFTADASHELRNPITAILTNSSVALRRTDGMREGDKEKFELIKETTVHMQNLVESLLRLSRAENVTTTGASTTLLKCAKEAIQSVKEAAARKSLKIESDIAENAMVQIDHEDLYRVISNLLENAIAYSYDGGTIRMHATRKNSHIELSVQDEGIGIAAADSAKVFDRFWRADKARNHADGGQGLGLSIVKAIVQSHDGAVTLKSEEGKGSVFIVLLKAASQADAPEGSA